MTGPGKDESRLPKCFGTTPAQLRAENAAQLQRIESDTFMKGDSSIDSDVTTYDTQAIVDRHANLLTKAETVTCFRKAASGIKVGDKPSVSTVKFAPRGYAAGNVLGTLTSRTSIPFRSKTIVSVVQFVFIVGRRLAASVEFSSVNRPIPASLRARVVNAVAARAAHV